MWRGPKRREELIVQALTARELFLRDQQYTVVDGKVVIVDEFTGRMMPGRTWREGLHQAVEAKEGLPVSAPSETLARISFQRYFRLYEKLSGMTGTASEAADEFWHVYRLPVIRIPTHRPCVRIERPDELWPDAAAKWSAVAARISELHATGVPVLVGTRHIASSQELARRLTELGIPFNLLNAVHHKEESRIVAEAGHPGRVTLATNMAGRGTDIRLGEGVAAMGGLRVIATERHEAGRIDRQLFGRCARQGDPGEVHVFVSLEDELLQRRVPAVVRRRIEAGLRQGRKGLRSAAIAAVRYAQFSAQRQAYQQRRAVLSQDKWIEEALAFTSRSKYS
jgi:preprotein translocase subunit SecA